MASIELRNEKKTMEEALEDRISKLPDSLLIQILSLLPITNEAFRTCLLSKRWRYLPTLIDSLNFTCLSCRPRENIFIIDNALAHSLSSKLKNFLLKFTDCNLCPLVDRCSNPWSEYDSLLDRCLSFAVERKVENVVLWLYGNGCTLPESLYTCSSLVSLNVQRCGFDIPAIISWNYLKSIKLGYLVIDDEQIVKLLSGCPELESMELYMFEGFHFLKINSLRLKTLKLKHYWFWKDGEDLEIFAPYLKYLEISGDFYNLKCKLVDVSSVVSATLTFNITCIKDYNLNIHEELDEEDSCRDYHQEFRTLVQDYLQKFSHATELTIGTWFTEVMCMLQFKGVSIPEFKCKYLTLDLHMKKFNLYGVAGFLRASPHVETLNINMETTPSDESLSHFVENSVCKFELTDLAKGDNMDLQSWVSSFNFTNLKKVKIVISSERCLKDHVKWGFVKLFNLLEILLKNATVLEKFDIISKRRMCDRCSMNCLSQYSSGLAEKLSCCPRSSTKFMIIFWE